MVYVRLSGRELTLKVWVKTRIALFFFLTEQTYLWKHDCVTENRFHTHTYTTHDCNEIACAIAIPSETQCHLSFACFNIFSLSSGQYVMSFNALNTHNLSGWGCCLPATAALWKLTRWLLHIRPDMPVALAKPMLTVGLFHSLILKSCFGPPPTQQNTPHCGHIWSGHLITMSKVG